MKPYFNSLLIAFSMFSKIPMPQKHIHWDEHGMKYMMAAFPVIGIVVGAVVFAWIRLSGWLGLPGVLSALGMTLVPIAVTGGIHLDGLADTSDALGAKVDASRRREILKDPRSGAFAIIGVCVYLVTYFGLALAFDMTMPNAVLLCTGFVLSRTLSGLAVTSFPSVSDGTAKMFHDAAAKRSIGILTFFTVLCAAAAGALLVTNQIGADKYIVWLLVQLGCFLYLRMMARRKFGGMSGDLAGWFLQMCEVLQLAAIVVCSYWRFS